MGVITRERACMTLTKLASTATVPKWQVSGAPPRPTGAKFSPSIVTSAPPGKPETRGSAARGAGGREASYCVTACDAFKGVYSVPADVESCTSTVR
eukprot:scaffold44050_cov48-Phaeocystis_antarctica.AAC.1